MIAGALVTTRPEAAAIIQGAAEAYVGESATLVQPISPIVAETLEQPAASRYGYCLERVRSWA